MIILRFWVFGIAHFVKNLSAEFLIFSMHPLQTCITLPSGRVMALVGEVAPQKLHLLILVRLSHVTPSLMTLMEASIISRARFSSSSFRQQPIHSKPSKSLLKLQIDLIPNRDFRYTSSILRLYTDEED